MSDYDTIDDDIVRAKEILERSKPTAVETLRKIGGGAIYGADVYTAYTLLERFVAEIEGNLGYTEQLRQDSLGMREAYLKAQTEIERLRAHNDLLQAGVEDCAKAVDEMQAERAQLLEKIRYLEDQIEP